jgi:hypothetical protein
VYKRIYHIYIKYNNLQGGCGGATSLKVAGSIPDGVIEVFNFYFYRLLEEQWVKVDKKAIWLSASPNF